MHTLSSFVFAALLATLPYTSYATPTSDPEITALVNFLVSNGLLNPGKSGQTVPRSYYTGTQNDIDNYFGDYLCKPANTCLVVDSVYNNPFAILGKGLPPQQGTPQQVHAAQAQLERTDIKYGADIYDAATWQIGLALASKEGYLDHAKAAALVDNQLQAIMNKEVRATSTSFKYGYTNPITDPTKAYTFRMIATHFINKDPFAQGRYQQDITWDYDPEKMASNDPDHHPASYFEAVSTWSDWKPITGENAWAQLIGPLQAEYLLNDGTLSENSTAMKNAMASLDAFSAMQAGIGAFYYAPEGSEGNQGPIPRGEISIENNFSLLGGLQILKRSLEQVTQTQEVIDALNKIAVMLNGGKTVNGYETIGLLSFIYNGAYDEKNGIFYTSGTAIIPSSQNDWTPNVSADPSASAVDINTWGTAALSPETIDQWFGFGTTTRIWQTVKAGGGYYHQGQLWGVGYTLQNNIGNTPENIMSTEWTAGAINALESMIAFYHSSGRAVSELEADLASMQQGIQNLRNDKYLAAGFIDATPKENFVTIPSEMGQGYLYASKRFEIPFGWFANTLPSTTSNAWVLMNKFKYNPFQFAGALTGEHYATPKKINITGGNTPPAGNALPKEVTVNFDAGNLGNITQLAMSYTTDGSQGHWINAATINGRSGSGVLPKGAQAISIAFNNNGWAGACQVIPATKVCKDDGCATLYTIDTAWSSDGKGACNLKE